MLPSRPWFALLPAVLLALSCKPGADCAPGFVEVVPGYCEQPDPDPDNPDDSGQTGESGDADSDADSDTDSDSDADADPWTPDADCPEGSTAGIESTLTLQSIPPGGGLRAINQGSTEGSTLYAGTETNGVYRMDEEWVAVYSPWAHIRSEIVVNPDDDHTILYGGGTDVYLSTNGGSTATKAAGVSATAPDEVWGLAWDPADGDRAWAVRTDGDVYRSTSEGESWTEVGHIAVNTNDKFNSLNLQWRVAPNPSGDDRVAFCCAFGATELSLDAGETWTEIYGGQGYARALFWDRTDPDVLYLGTDDGLRMTRDNGSTWDTVAGTSGTVRYADQSDDGSLLVTLSDEGELSVNGSGTTDLGVEPWALLVTHGNDPDIVVGTEEYVRTSDDGASWSDITDGMIDKGISSFGVDPRCASVVWVGTICSRGMYESDSYGDNWIHNSEFFHYVMTIHWSPVVDDEVWVTSDNVVLRTEDRGATWESVAATAGSWHFHGLALHPSDPDIALVGSTASGVDADHTANVYLTEDGGESWDLGGGLPDNSGSVYTIAWVNDEVALLGGYPGDLFHDGAAGFGLYRSVDGGHIWEHEDSVDSDNIARLLVAHGLVWAATDQGLWKSDDDGESFARVAVTDDETESLLAVAWRPHDEDVGAVLTQGMKVYLTRDGGDSWSELESSDVLAENDDTTEADIAFSTDGTVLYVAAPLTGLWRALID